MSTRTVTSRRHSLASRAARRMDLLREMTRIRLFEERCVELYSAETIRGFLHVAVGEEAVAAGLMNRLAEDDAVVSTYREHGHALARGLEMDAVMAEMYGKQSGCSRGRGGSMHLFDVDHKFYGGNAIVAGGLPLAIGLALADKMQDRPRVTVCLFGDGAFAEGELHESVNLAALWQLPVLFACENNLYAMGTALRKTHAQTDLALRASSYGIASWAVDGMDVEAVDQAAERTLERVRYGGGPAFLEARTYRFRAHSMYDPDRYRDKAEVAAWRERDPIEMLARRMTEAGELSADGRAEMVAAVTAEVEAAVQAAEAAPLEPVEDLTRFVYSEHAEA